MLLLHLLPACPDAGSDLCTFCPHLCTLRPDFCTLCLWCYPSINQHTYSTCTHGAGHWLQLALVAFFLQPWAQTVLAPVVVSPVATCAGGLLLPPTGAHTPLSFEQHALCGIYSILMCLTGLTSPFHHAMQPVRCLLPSLLRTTFLLD